MVYQTGSTGGTGMGYDVLGGAGQPDVAEQSFFATDSTGRELFRIKHLSTKVSADTLKTQSFDWVEGGGRWEPRRVYYWVRPTGRLDQGLLMDGWRTDWWRMGRIRTTFSDSPQMTHALVPPEGGDPWAA